MLEGLAAGILSSYLGAWIEGLERENLKIGIKQGNVTIENLKLRKEALRDLQLPIAIKAGYLGKLQLIIPWSNLSSKPAIIRIERVFLTAGPLHQDSYDPQEEERKDQETKQKRLALRELFNTKDKKEESDTFTARLVAKVVANLQLFIEKIHIRYEDDTQNAKAPFAIGITLERLNAETTDEAWRPTFMKENQPLVYKLVSLSNFAIYWDSNTVLFDHFTEKVMCKTLEEMIHEEKKEIPRHAYVLRPISSTLKLVMNKNTAARDIPKFTFNLFFEKIALELQENQYREMLGLLESFGIYQRSLQHRAYKPPVSVAKDPRAWWAFAANASLASKREEKRKWSFDAMKEANTDRKRYVRLYKRHLDLEQKKQHLTPTDAAALAALEKRLDYDRIVLFRSLAEAYLEKEKEFKEREKQKRIESEKAAGTATASGYGGGIWKWWTGAAADTDPTPDLELTDAVWKELYAAVDDEYLSSTHSNQIEKAEVHLHIEEGSFQLKNAAPVEPTTENLAILLFVFNGLHIDLTTTTNYSSIKMDGRLNTMQAFDFNTPNTKYSLLLTPALPTYTLEQALSRSIHSGKEERRSSSQTQAKKKEEEEEADFDDSDPCFFRFFFASYPPKEAEVDYKLRVDMQPLNVVFNEAIVGRISRFFRSAKRSAPTQVVLHDMEDRVSNKLEQFRDQSHQQFAWLLEYKKVFDIRINIKAPTIVVPLSFEEESSPALLLDFGQLSLRSDLSADKRRRERERDKTLSDGDGGRSVTGTVEEDFYSKFLLHLTSLQAFITTQALGASEMGTGEESQTGSLITRQQIIEKFDLHFIVRLNKLKATPLTSTKIEGELPSLSFCLSAWSCENLMRILATRIKLSPPEADAASTEDDSSALSSAPPSRTSESSGLQPAEEPHPLAGQRAPSMSAVLRDKKRLQVDFTVKSLSISVYREKECIDLRTCSPMVFFRAQGMNIRMVRRLLDIQLEGALQTILLRDYYQQWGNDFRDLLVPQFLPAATSASSSLSSTPSSMSSSAPAPSFFLSLMESSSPLTSPRVPTKPSAPPLRRSGTPTGLALSTPTPVPTLSQPLFEFRLFKPLAGEPSATPHAPSEAGLLELQLRDLQLMVNQETLTTLVKFVNANVFRPLKRARPSTTSPASSAPTAPPTPPPRYAPLRVAAILGCIKFTINHGGQHLAEGFLDRSRFEVLPEPQGTRVEGNVGHLKLLDLASSISSTAGDELDPAITRAFQEIIMVQGGTDALTFTIKLARPSTANSTAPPASSSLEVSVTGVKVALVHQFFSRLLGYAAELRSLIAPTSPKAAVTAVPISSATMSAVQEFPPFKLNITIKNGTLLLPEKCSDSMSVALATIGSFSITNDGTDAQRRIKFAVRGMDVDWGAVTLSTEDDGNDAASYFAKKHSLAKGIALDVIVGLPRVADDAVRASLPLQDIQVISPKLDVGFTTLHGVHVFGILEELLDGLFRKHGVLEHLDVLLADEPHPPRLELHRKRRVLVSIDKLVLRLLPSALEKDTIPSFLLDASELRVECNWTSDDRLAVDLGTSAAFLMQYSPLAKQTFKALTLERTEENRAFWLTYDKKPSAQGAHVSQAIAVGLGKATALAVPEGIRRLFDAIPLIWGALSRATEKTGRGPPADSFVFTFSVVDPSTLGLYPSFNYLAVEEAKASSPSGEIRTYGSFNFTLRKRMDASERVTEEQMRIDCPSMIDTRQAGAKASFASARGLMWIYSPAIVPESENGKQSNPPERRMSIEARALDLLLSADEINYYYMLWQVWRGVAASNTSSTQNAGETGSEQADSASPTKESQCSPALIVRTQFKQANIGLLGLRSPNGETEIVRILDISLGKLAFVIKSAGGTLSLAGGAGEGSLQDPLAMDHCRVIASLKAADTNDVEDRLSFTYCDMPSQSAREPQRLLKIDMDGLWLLFIPTVYSRFFYFIGSLRSVPEPQDKSKPPPVPMKLDVMLRRPLLQIPHAPIIDSTAQAVALITGDSFSISNLSYFDEKPTSHQAMLEQFWFKLRNGTLRLGSLPFYTLGDTFDQWKAITRSVDLDLLFERPLHDPLRTYPVHHVRLSFPSPVQFTALEREAVGVLRSVDVILAGLFHQSTNPIMPSIDRAFPSAPALNSFAAPTVEKKHYRIDVPSLTILLNIEPNSLEGVKGCYSFLFEQLHVDVNKYEPSELTCIVRSSSVSVSDVSSSTPTQLLSIASFSNATSNGAEVLVAEGQEPESAFKLTYQKGVGRSSSHMMQKLDLALGRSEVLVIDLRSLFSALGQLRLALNAALAKMDQPLAPVLVVDVMTYKLMMNQTSVLAPHPVLNYLASDKAKASSPSVSEQNPSVFFVLRAEDLKVDVVKELLSVSPSMSLSSSATPSSSHVYEVGAVMTDLEFSKCQATSPVSHLGSFISSTSESSIPILDPISGSMKVSTREQLDISFDTGLIGIHLPLQDVSPLQALQRNISGLFSADTASTSEAKTSDAAAPTTIPEDGSAEEWMCAECTLINTPDASLCALCGKPRVEDKPAMSTPADEPLDDDWTMLENRQRSGSERWMCENCSMLNMSSAHSCAMCEKRRPTHTDSNCADASLSRNPTEQLIGTSIAKPKKKKSVRVSPLHLMVDLIDEDLGIPLYQLTATANVDIDNRHHHLGHMKAVVSLNDVTINYFNSYKEVSEVLLEPWNFQIKIMRHPRLPTKMVLQSSGKLELNLTRPFLEMTSRVMSEKKWTADDSSSADKRVTLVRPEYTVSSGQTLAIVRNETGVDLFFNLSNRNSTSTTRAQNWVCPVCTLINHPTRSVCEACRASRPSERLEEGWAVLHPVSTAPDSSTADMRGWIKLASGEERSVKLPPPRRIRTPGRRGQTVSYGDATLSVKLDGPFRTLHNLPVHPPGKSTLNVTPEARKRMERIDVLYLIGNRRGIKFMCFRSPLRINNYTNFAMRVLVQVPPPLHALEMTCPERSNAPIPISLAATEGVIRVAPVAAQGQVGWLYSDHGLQYQGTVTKPDTKFLTCRWTELPASARAAAVPPPFVLRVAVKGASESRRLLILPPLKLHNLLPVDLSYRVFDADTKRCFVSMMSGKLAPGQDTNLHIFDISSMKSKLALTVQFGNFQWSAAVLIHGRQDAKIINVPNEQQQPIRLRMLRQKDTGEVHHIRVYADYWLINKTGLRLTYLQGDQHEKVPIPGQKRIAAKTRLEGDPREWYKDGAPWAVPQPETLLLSMTGDGGEQSSSLPLPQQSVFVRMATSKFSQALHLSAGASGVIALEDAAGPAVFQVAVGAHEAPGPFWRTRVVTFSPYRVLVNRLKVTVEYQQAGTRDVFRLHPDEALPWHWVARDIRPRHIRMRIVDPPSDWSGPFLLTLPQPVTLSMRGHGTQTRHAVHPLIRVEGRLAGATQYVILRPENATHPLYRIENRSSFTILVRQKPRDTERTRERGDKVSPTTVEEIQPHSSIPFGWDDPVHEKTVNLKIISPSMDVRPALLSVSLDEFKRYPPLQNFHPSLLLIEVLPSGPTTVLRISEGALRRRGKSMEMIRTEPEGMQEGIEKVAWEAQVMIDSIILSLIDDASGPLVRAAIATPLLYLSSSDLYHKVELTVWDLRLQNLLPSTPFPLLLAPLRPPSSRSSSRREPSEMDNFLHFTAVKVRGVGDVGADYLKYVGLAVQPFDINAEGAILMKLMAFKDRVIEALKASGDTSDGNAAAALAMVLPASSTGTLFDPPSTTENKALCLGQVDLHHVACRLSFKYVSGFDYSSLHSILSWTGGLANIDSAPLRFNALCLRNTLSTREEVMERVKRHYANEVQQQIGRLLGHLSVLGAPLSFVTGLGSSTSELFSESSRSVVRSPHEFGRGVPSTPATYARPTGRESRGSMSTAQPSTGGASIPSSSRMSMGERPKPNLRDSLSTRSSSSTNPSRTSAEIPRSSSSSSQPRPTTSGGDGGVDLLGLGRDAAIGAFNLGARPVGSALNFVSSSVGSLASTVASNLPTPGLGGGHSSSTSSSRGSQATSSSSARRPRTGTPPY